MELRLTKGGESRTATVPDNTNLEKLAAAGYQVELLPAAPPPARKESQIGPWESGFQGVVDPLLGGVQLGSHLTGIGTESLDKFLADREAKLQARGIGEHPWARFAGDALSPINYLPGGILGRLGVRGLSRALGAGAGVGLLQPTEPGDNYATSKAEQAAVGAGTGLIFHGAEKLARSRRVPTPDEVRAEAKRLTPEPGTIGEGHPEAAPPGTVRFYHGGSRPWSGGGRWVTPDPEYALSRGPLHYVDIPQAELDRRFDPDLFGPGKMSYPHFEAPESVAKQMLPARKAESTHPYERMSEADMSERQIAERDKARQRPQDLRVDARVAESYRKMADEMPISRGTLGNAAVSGIAAIANFIARRHKIPIDTIKNLMDVAASQGAPAAYRIKANNILRDTGLTFQRGRWYIQNAVGNWSLADIAPAAAEAAAGNWIGDPLEPGAAPGLPGAP